MIGDAVVENGDRSSEMVIHTKTPVLRQKHLIQETQTGDVLCDLQLATQRMVLAEGKDPKMFGVFLIKLQEAMDRHPELAVALGQVNAEARSDHWYRAHQIVMTVRDNAQAIHDETAD